MNFKQFFFLKESEVSYETAKKIYKSLPKKEQELLSHYFLEGENKKLLYRVGNENCFVEVVDYFGDKNSGYINVAVSPKARGQGLAKKYVKEAIEKMKDYKLKKMYYFAEKSNESSCALANSLKIFKKTDSSDPNKRAWIYEIES